MTAVFDCPDCGAPIKFDPDPGDTTVVCSYCGETVIIPTDIRIPMPAPQTVPNPQPWWRNWMVIGILLVAVLGIAWMALQSNNTSSTSYDSVDMQVSTVVAEQSAAETAQAQADIEAQATSDAQAVIESRATAQALSPIIKEEQNWPVLLTDNFNDTSNAWDSGDVRESNLTGSRKITDGKYIWDVTSTTSAFNSSFPDATDQTDFFASVEIKYNSMPDDPSADAGFILRYNDTDQTWYYFSVNQNGQYYFGRYDGQAWHTLIPETDSNVFQIGKTNQLAVGVQGSQFIFLINGQVVDSFDNANYKAGIIGLAVNLPQPDQKASFEFSKFTVLAPAPAQ